MKYQFKRQPRSYQLKALQKGLSLGKLALWFDPGLGKTKVAIDFTAIKHIKEGAKKVLVLCPLSAIGVWEDEFPLDIPDGINYKTTPVVGDKQEALDTIEKAKLYAGLNIIIVNYDKLIPRTKEEKLDESPVFKALYKWTPDILIVDEMHYLKSHTSLRNKKVYKLRKKVKNVLGLTGTPIPKNPLDLFGQYKILDDTIFGVNYGDFKNYYAIPHYMFPNKVKDWKNLDDMARKIHLIAYRAKDTECIGLPPLITQDIPVYLTKKSQDVYTQMAKEMIAELDNMEIVTAAIAAVKAGKLQQITGGFIQRTDKYLEGDKVKKQAVTFPVGTEKLDVFMDLVDRYVEEHKLLVGCRFLWEIAQIEQRLTKAGIKFVTIKGGVDGQERAEAKRLYQNDATVRVIIFQVSAATAMTLTAGDIGILYSCTHKWDDYMQWQKRIHREGQTKPVYILRLIARGTVDKDVYNSIEEKRGYTDTIIDKPDYRNMLMPKF